MGVDALAEQTLSWSPYQFGYNSPAMFNDPTGLQADYSWFWDQIIERANKSPNGFIWKNTGVDKDGNYGTLTEFGSEDEAFGFGISYMNQTGGWGSYSWWAKSSGHALQRYNGSTGITLAMVTGYYMNKWSGTSRRNINASYAGGVHLGKGFNVGFDYDGALGTPTVGSLYVSNSQMMEILMGGENNYSYKFMDDFGQIINAGGVMWGAAELGGKYLQNGNSIQSISRNIGIGVNQVKAGLNGTINTLGKWGGRLGTAGMVLSSINYGAQLLDASQTISTATHVNFWASAAVYSAAIIIGGPVTGAIALSYGIGQLGSYLFTGKSLEQNIIGE